jgi:DsbC/DsbD-like thiol-disulfide interchange protein
MSPIRRWGLLLALCAPLWAMAQGPVGKTAEVEAELVAHGPQGVAPGKPVWLGLVLRHAPHWHTYRQNPGDSALATTPQWQFPAGVTAGAVEWPTPQCLPIGPLVNDGCEGTPLLAARFAVTGNFAAAALDVGLRTDWLVCREQCIPRSRSSSGCACRRRRLRSARRAV